MNRKQRRQNNVKEHTKTYTISEFNHAVQKEADRLISEELQKVYDRQRKHLVETTLKSCLELVIKVLHDNEKWRKKRLGAFYGQYLQEFDKLTKGDIKLQDIEDLAKKMNIDIKFCNYLAYRFRSDTFKNLFLTFH